MVDPEPLMRRRPSQVLRQRRILVKNALVCLETIIFRSIGVDEPPGDKAFRRTRRKLKLWGTFVSCRLKFTESALYGFLLDCWCWLRYLGKPMDAVFFRVAGEISEGDGDVVQVKPHASGAEFPMSWYGEGGDQARGMLMQDMSHINDDGEVFLQPGRLSGKYGWREWHWRNWMAHEPLRRVKKDSCWPCRRNFPCGSGAITGELSPTFPITISEELKAEVGLPAEATHFCFSYPIEGLEWSQEEADDPIELKFLKRGGFLYFQKKIEDGHWDFCRLVLSSFAWIGFIFEMLGFWCCVPTVLSPFKLVKIKVYTEATTSENALFMSVPHVVKPKDYWRHWSFKRRVSSKILRDRGAEYFSWVLPSDSLGSEACPLGYPHGGFLYFGRFSKDAMETIRNKFHEKWAVETNDLKNDWLSAHAAAFKEVVSEDADAEKKHKLNQAKLLAKELNDLQEHVGGHCMDNIANRMDTLVKVRSGLQVITAQGFALRMYFTVMWVRFPFFFLNLTFLIIGNFAGAVMTILFTVLGAGMGEPDNLPLRAEALFMLLPFLTVFLAVIVDQLADLITDSLSPPFFVRSRSTMLTAHCAFWKLNKPGPTVCLLMDVFFGFWLECVPVLGALYNIVNFECKGCTVALFYRGHGGLTNAVVAGYVTGLLYMCGFFAFIHTVADVAYGMFEWKRSPDTSLEYTHTLIHNTIKGQYLVPMSLWWRHDCFIALDEGAGVTYESEEQHRHGARSRRGIWRYHEQQAPRETFQCTIYVVIACCMFWVFLGELFLRAQSGSMYFAALMMTSWVVATVAISLKLRDDFPQLIGNTYFGVLLFMSVLVFGLIFVQRGQDTEMLTKNNEVLAPMMVVEPPYNGTLPRPAQQPVKGDDLPRWWRMPAHAVRYPICRRTWGSNVAPVGALDLAALSWIAYEVESDNIKDLIPQHFADHRRVTYLRGTHYEQIPRWFAVHFAPAEGAGFLGEEDDEGTVVIAVKGTSTLADTYLDTALFTSIKVLQVFNFIAPVLVSLPVDMVQWLLAEFRNMVGETPAFQVFDHLAAEIKNMMQDERYANTRFVLTGHSLGGGIAQVVAAKVGIEALVWSAPGTLYTERYFSITEEEVQRDVTVVVPDRDLVPRVDTHEAAVQMIQCYLKNHQVPGPQDSAVCHSIVKSACEIWRVCGDPEERNFSASCSQYVNATTELGRVYPQQDHPIWDPYDDR